MIDIIVPVLGRPQNAAPLVENIRATTIEEHRIVFVCSLGDTEQISVCNTSGADLIIVAQYPAGPGDYAKKINVGVTLNSEWVFQAADDLVFQPGWDTAALRAGNSGPGYDVIATNDLANRQVQRGEFGTHNLVRRRYVTEKLDGKILYEGYDHNFVDRELSGWAKHHGVYRYAPHSRVKHQHPMWRTAPHDPTYKKALRHFQQDRRLFLSRAHLWDYHGLSAPERKLAA